MSDSVAPAQPTEGLRGEIEVVEPSRAERTLARRSAETRATIPTVELSAEVSMDAAMALEGELGCGTSALIVRACAVALRTVPRVNGAYRDGRYELYGRVNIAVTLIGDGIYATPTILDADEKSAADVAGELAGFYERLRAGEDLRGNEAAGATFTVLDGTAQRITALTPIVTPPQAAALAAGPVRAVAVVRDGGVVPGRALTATLSVDHRIVYGQLATSFLEAVKGSLEEAQG